MEESADHETYNPLPDFKEFDETKAGVKGLVDSGITKIPRFFIHSPESLPKPSDVSPNTDLQIPIIDLHCKEIVGELYRASVSWGFFQLVNHGIPIGVLDSMIEGVRGFHEGEKEVKEKIYSRDLKKKVKYASNLSLYQLAAANWRDTLTCVFDGDLDPSEIPPICREALMEYRKHILGITETLYELLSEALGLESNHIRGLNCAKTQLMVAHYYPPCPEPELTLGTSTHTDPSFLTVLLQDGLGGLQVFHQGHWVNVTPIHGALVVNIGDLLQLVSNDKFKSVEHRVLASPRRPRMSVAMFLSPNFDEQKPIGPIKELISDENPPVYKEILVYDYIRAFTSKGISSSTLSHFKL